MAATAVTIRLLLERIKWIADTVTDFIDVQEVDDLDKLRHLIDDKVKMICKAIRVHGGAGSRGKVSALTGQP